MKFIQTLGIHKRYFSMIISLVIVLSSISTNTYVEAVALNPSIIGYEGTTVEYDELSSTPIQVAPSIEVIGDASYLEFQIDGAKESEYLGVETVETPVIDSGVVSYDGSYFYLGDGSGADIIAAVDEANNGQNGKELVVNFSKPLSNATFTQDFSDGVLPGWTVYEKLLLWMLAWLQEVKEMNYLLQIIQMGLIQ